MAYRTTCRKCNNIWTSKQKATECPQCNCVATSLLDSTFDESIVHNESVPISGGDIQTGPIHETENEKAKRERIDVGNKVDLASEAEAAGR